MGTLLHFLGKPYVLDLLRVFVEDPRPHRFVELQQRLQVSPNTLTARLRDLVEAGFLTRTSFNEIPPRVDYAVTRKARELNSVFETLSDWSKRHDLTATPVITVGRNPPG